MITQQQYDKGIRCQKRCIFCKDYKDCFQLKVKKMKLQGCRYTPPYVGPQKPYIPPRRTAMGWCKDDLNLDCSDYGRKCKQCSNLLENQRVSHFKKMDNNQKYGCYEHNGEKNICDSCIHVSNGCTIKYTNKID